MSLLDWLPLTMPFGIVESGVEVGAQDLGYASDALRILRLVLLEAALFSLV